MERSGRSDSSSELARGAADQSQTADAPQQITELQQRAAEAMHEAFLKVIGVDVRSPSAFGSSSEAARAAQRVGDQARADLMRRAQTAAANFTDAKANAIIAGHGWPAA